MKKTISACLILIFIGAMLILPTSATAFTTPTTMTRSLVSSNFYVEATQKDPFADITDITPFPEKQWTFMVYMAADNNLDPAALDDINEMEMAGSTGDVNIIVLLDRWDEKAPSGTWVYYIQPDTDPDDINSELIGELDEINMGDPFILQCFVRFVTTYFPAENYGLVLWDHGHGWFGVCWDWTDGDYLDIDEIQWALTDLPKLALIGFDACLMSMIEVAYDFVDLADVMVASEEYEPWDGWPYDMFLVDLVNNPWWTAKELAREIVDDYIESYSTDGFLRAFVTMAAIDLKELPTLVELIDELAVFLIDHLSEYYGVITKAKNSADRYPFGFAPRGSFIDLYHFVSLLETDNGNLKLLVEKILNTWEDVVIATKSYNKMHKHALGLTIYFPVNAKLGYYPEKYSTAGLDFVEETYWNEFLAAYFG